MIDINDNRLQQFGYLGLKARQVVEGFITGLHKSPFHGFSVEFSEHRSYNSGEDTRHIDWKLFSRTERLFVKRYEEETNLRCQLVIDGSKSMLFPNDVSRQDEMQSKFKYAIYLAAVFMQLCRLQRDAVGLSVVTSKLETHTQSKSTFAHIQLLMNILQNHLSYLPKLENDSTSFVQNMHLIAERIHKRSMVIIISDLMDENHNPEDFLNAIQHLKHNGHEVIVFNTIDKTFEENFVYDNRPYKFIDLENKSIIKVRPAEIRDNYVKLISDYLSEIRIQCPKYKVDFIDVDIQNSLEKTLLSFFAKRSAY